MSGSGRTGVVGRLALRCQPDTRLIALVRDGSDPAFEEVVGRYRRRLVAYAAGIVPADRAEDVVQESLVRALSAIRNGDAEINLRPWLHTIVRNRALNDLRDEPVHDHLHEDYDGVPQPPDVAARREELASLVDRVKALPDAQRNALVQRELEGRSHEEIAEALAVSPGAVRGLIFRARSALRDAAGLLVPMPLLRALAVSPSAGDGAAAVAAAGGGGALVKLGAALTVAAVTVGSGAALQGHEGGGDQARADTGPPAHSAPGRGAARHAALAPRTALAIGRGESGDDRGRGSAEGPGSDSSGPGPGGSSSSGPGPGGSGPGSPGRGSSGSSGAGSSGSGRGGLEESSSGPGSSGGGSSDDGGSFSSSGPGPGSTSGSSSGPSGGDDHGGSPSSGPGSGSSSGSTSSGPGSSGPGGGGGPSDGGSITSGSGVPGGGSGSGVSGGGGGPGSGDVVEAGGVGGSGSPMTTTTPDGGSSGSGESTVSGGGSLDGGGSGSSGSGSRGGGSSGPG